MPKVDHRINLTDRKIKALKPAAQGQRYQVMDLEVGGFGVRVTDTGAKTFILRTRFPGSDSASRRELGKYPALTLAEAREKARRWSALVKRGIDPALSEEREAAENQRKRESTFEAVACDWFREKLATERKGAEVERDVRNQFFPTLSALPITEVCESDILTIVKAKKSSAPTQARNLLGHAKRFFTWAVDQRCYGLKESPCERLRAASIVGAKKSGKRILSNDEIFALWRGAERMPYPYGPIYKLLLLNALRLNEVADAQRTEFNRREKIWVVPESRMKGRNETARPHAVPLTAASLDVLDSLPTFKSGPFVFSTTLGRSPVWMSNKVKKRLDRRMLLTLRALARERGDEAALVTLPRWTNHDIRRSVRSQLSRLKVTEEAREAVLAHARPGIKGTYDLHDYLDQKLEALELWAIRLKQIVSPPPNNVVRLQAIA